MTLDPRLLAVLACPQDKGPLYYLADPSPAGEDALYNPRIPCIYVVREGIPVMLVDEAKPVSKAEAKNLDARIAAGELTPTFV
ncbi:MAG: Trm112 family protein [Actinobacteria bacterium]|nr:Trm112 family protein [Actinomycetota bacterium]